MQSGKSYSDGFLGTAQQFVIADIIFGILLESLDEVYQTILDYTNRINLS